MSYRYGQSPIAILRAQNTRLLEQIERMKNLHAAEQRKWRAETNKRSKIVAEARREAEEIRHLAQLEAEDITRQARETARQTVLDAENQAGHIREKAYDQGLALADRDYLDRKVRQYDLDRARRSTLGNCEVSR